jgi:methyl-accepting chemotaxis protein
MSIRKRLYIVLILLSFVAILLTGVASYKLNLDNARAEAKARASLLSNFMLSVKELIRHNRVAVHELAGTDQADTPESGSLSPVSTLNISGMILKKNQEYEFKQAAIDPMAPQNKADGNEVEIIKRFKEDAALQIQEGMLDRNGTTYYYLAHPVRAEQSCLECHGSPESAPSAVTAKYGNEHGFNWKIQETIATMVTYVPIQGALDKATKNALYSTVAGMILILAISLIIWFYVGRTIVKPVTEISRKVDRLSLGKELEESVHSEAADEFGVLLRAVDRLRISVLKFIGKVKK